MRVYLKTFGCRANHYDTERVRAMVLAGGHEVSERVEDADVAVFNGCAVTAAAEAELRKSVRRAHRTNAALSSVIMGCASSPELAQLPGVREVVPGADLVALGASLGLARTAAAPQTTVRAVLRVQDGCDEHCTFCATTLARGANRSRPMDELVREASMLAEHHPEIVITGIHIGSYGADIETSLGELMERLCRDVPASRFRLSSLEATEVDDRLFELLTATDSNLVPYLHAPLQSGSDRVLKRMGRHWYTASSYAASVERLVAARPVFGLGADVIAGFPGETEADHAATLALVEALPFSYLHVFPFSLRPGTAAERLNTPVAAPVIDRRAAQLRVLSGTIAATYAGRRAGGLADVVVIGGERGARTGLTEDYLDVAVPDSMPRGSRFAGRLEGSVRLAARPVD